MSRTAKEATQNALKNSKIEQLSSNHFYCYIDGALVGRCSTTPVNDASGDMFVGGGAVDVLVGDILNDTTGLNTLAETVDEIALELERHEGGRSDDAVRGASLVSHLRWKRRHNKSKSFRARRYRKMLP